MRKSIGFIELIIVLSIVVIIIKGLAYKNFKPEQIGNMVYIKGGTFQMGKGDVTKYNQGNSVTVSSFYMGKYEVTNKEYCQYDPKHKGEWSDSDYPVESVDWDDARGYCQWLSQKTGKNYRLPTEAEWEYACRAGSSTDYYWGEDMNREIGDSPNTGNFVWYNKNSDNQLHSVGQKKPNAWGLYDMVGNVFEWCGDCYDVPNLGRVYRGGSYSSDGYNCVPRLSNSSSPSYRYINLGFRVVMTP